MTISDSTFTGDRSDTSGAAIRSWCDGRGDQVVSHDKVSDEASEISPLLASLCDSGSVDLVLTTGGTGLSPRDVTPEATRTVLEREAPGISEFIRSASYDRFPRAALSRGVAGTRASTLVVNLPGSPSGVQDGLRRLGEIVDHAVGVLSGAVSRHDNPESVEQAQ